MTWWSLYISIREYCERTKERFAKCSTFDMTRQFLVDHIQRIVYMRSKVTILGSVPVKRGPFQAAAPVPFRIEGELDRKAIQRKPHKVLPDDGRWKKLTPVSNEYSFESDRRGSMNEHLHNNTFCR
jgi:hypothetical protein